MIKDRMKHLEELGAKAVDKIQDDMVFQHKKKGIRNIKNILIIIYNVWNKL